MRRTLNISGTKVIKKGDVAKGFAASDHIFEGRFRTQMVEHERDDARQGVHSVGRPVQHREPPCGSVCRLRQQDDDRCVVASHDCGTSINPMLVEGQVEGGISMGVGFALQEEILVGAMWLVRLGLIWPTAEKVFAAIKAKRAQPPKQIAAG